MWKFEFEFQHSALNNKLQVVLPVASYLGSTGTVPVRTNLPCWLGRPCKTTTYKGNSLFQLYRASLCVTGGAILFGAVFYHWFPDGN